MVGFSRLYCSIFETTAGVATLGFDPPITLETCIGPGVDWDEVEFDVGGGTCVCDNALVFKLWFAWDGKTCDKSPPTGPSLLSVPNPIDGDNPVDGINGKHPTVGNIRWNNVAIAAGFAWSVWVRFALVVVEPIGNIDDVVVGIRLSKPSGSKLVSDRENDPKRPK